MCDWKSTQRRTMMNSPTRLARQAVLDLIPYSSARHESNLQTGIHLDANENPFQRQDDLNRYPDPQPMMLLQKLSQLYGLNTPQILMTRGSDEGIDLLLRVFCEAGRDGILITQPTYGMYEVAAGIQGALIKRVPLIPESGFRLDVAAIMEQWQPSTKLIFLCSPNNPTGNVFPAEELTQLCEYFMDKALIVVDEAYIEFSTSESLSQHLSRYPNLVLLRTLSKAYGLAAIRFGCVLGSPTVIALLKKVIAPYPIPVLVSKVVLDALSGESIRVAQSQIKAIQTERERLRLFLKTLPSVQTVYPSEANFLLVRVADADAWMAKCRDQRIVIRSRSSMLNLNQCVRISIGTTDENQRLQEVLSNV